MEIYVVYIRSMCTYTDYYKFNKLDKGEYIEYESELGIFESIGYFNDYDIAYNWLLTNGKKFTNNFFDLHEQGCAFVIMLRKTIEPESLDDDFLSLKDLYFLDLSRYHYTFSKKSYNMCLTEHLRYASRDWDSPFPGWIKYVQDKNNITIGSNTTHIKKVHKLYNYIDDNCNKKEIKTVTKYLKTKNLDDIKDISGKVNNF